MRTIAKIVVVLILAIFVLGAGYSLVLNNISSLLATGRPNLQCRWISSGLEIKTGNWVEVVGPMPTVRISRKAGTWIFQSKKIILMVSTSPKLRIQWKKSLSRRISPMNGEY